MAFAAVTGFDKQVKLVKVKIVIRKQASARRSFIKRLIVIVNTSTYFLVELIYTNNRLVKSLESLLIKGFEVKVFLLQLLSVSDYSLISLPLMSDTLKLLSEFTATGDSEPEKRL